jgi:hypothetical protein
MILHQIKKQTHFLYNNEKQMLIKMHVAPYQKTI